MMFIPFSVKSWASETDSFFGITIVATCVHTIVQHQPVNLQVIKTVIYIF